jgi:hypothetical protein
MQILQSTGVSFYVQLKGESAISLALEVAKKTTG